MSVRWSTYPTTMYVAIASTACHLQYVEKNSRTEEIGGIKSQIVDRKMSASGRKDTLHRHLISSEDPRIFIRCVFILSPVTISYTVIRGENPTSTLLLDLQTWTARSRVSHGVTRSSSIDNTA